MTRLDAAKERQSEGEGGDARPTGTQGLDGSVPPSYDAVVADGYPEIRSVSVQGETSVTFICCRARDLDSPELENR
jgi:hypothetical protein